MPDTSASEHDEEWLIQEVTARLRGPIPADLSRQISGWLAELFGEGEGDIALDNHMLWTIATGISRGESPRRRSQLIELARTLPGDAYAASDAYKVAFIVAHLNPDIHRPFTNDEVDLLHHLSRAALRRHVTVDRSTSEAKNLYRRLSARGEQGQFPYFMERTGLWTGITFADWAEIFTVMFHGMRGNETKPSGAEVVELISPWHAALWGMLIRQHWADHPRPLFRGQRKARWEIMPSISRSATDADLASRALPFFRTYMRLIWRFGDDKVTEDMTVAMAQHYGIPTHFLDYTSDPSAAVLFASSKKDEDDQVGVVFVLPIEEAMRSDMKVVLAPSFARRIYLQRGLFLSSDAARAPALREVSGEIRFPVDQSFKVRRGGTTVDLLPLAGPVKRLAGIAIAWAGRHEILPSSNDEWRLLFQRETGGTNLPKPRHASNPTVDIRTSAADLVLYLITYLANMDVAIDRQVLDHVASTNMAAVSFLYSEFDNIFEVPDDGRASTAREALRGALARATI